MRPERRGLIGDGDRDQTFGTAAPGALMALAVVRALRTAGWTRVAALAIAVTFAVGALAIVLSMVLG